MKISTNISDSYCSFELGFELPNYRQFCMDNQGHAEGVKDALSKDAKSFRLECAGQICPHTTEELVEDFMSRVLVTCMVEGRNLPLPILLDSDGKKNQKPITKDSIIIIPNWYNGSVIKKEL